MKKLFLFVLFFAFLTLPLAAQEGGGGDESTAIKAAVMDYIEGWYEGSAERMERALHPDLQKVTYQPLPTGRQLLQHASASVMIEATRAGFGKKPEDKRNIEVTILDVYKNIATVKITSADFVDYAHVIKYNGEWKIVNVLWERNTN